MKSGCMPRFAKCIVGDFQVEAFSPCHGVHGVHGVR